MACSLDKSHIYDTFTTHLYFLFSVRLLLKKFRYEIFKTFNEELLVLQKLHLITLEKCGRGFIWNQEGEMVLILF